jgi:hypothetical protein
MNMSIAGPVPVVVPTGLGLVAAAPPGRDRLIPAEKPELKALIL